MKLGLEAGVFTLELAVEQGVQGVPIEAANLVADGDAMRIYGSYTSGPMTVAASFENVDVSATADE